MSRPRATPLGFHFVFVRVTHRFHGGLRSPAPPGLGCSARLKRKAGAIKSEPPENTEARKARQYEGTKRKVGACSSVRRGDSYKGSLRRYHHASPERRLVAKTSDRPPHRFRVEQS